MKTSVTRQSAADALKECSAFETTECDYPLTQSRIPEEGNPHDKHAFYFQQLTLCNIAPSTN
jgi:hypothetical protein